MDLIYSVIAVIGTLVVAFIVSLFLPGIERKFISRPDPAEGRPSHYQPRGHGSP